uniref:Uncharacterized protein n=1 Tax=Rhizophagus irregularis (strain DAOM 181602 / DAOM 197198 / MUCL 43194) TaxID=747089 RepID=U9UHV7_RHIID
MTAFFPYKKDGKILENNSVEPSDIPNGRVEVPFTTDTGFSLKFVSGFLGSQQKTLDDSNEVVVSPIIGCSRANKKLQVAYHVGTYQLNTKLIVILADIPQAYI